jgi:hypothetical protein
VRSDRRRVRQHGQHLGDAVEGLPLVACGELGKIERLVAHLVPAHPAQLGLVVRLNGDCQKERGSQEYEQP